jgi:hypothetical protein
MNFCIADAMATAYNYVSKLEVIKNRNGKILTEVVFPDLLKTETFRSLGHKILTPDWTPEADSIWEQ